MGGLELKIAPDAGRVLRVARVVADRKQQDIARAAGISCGHLSSIETGDARLTPALAERVARAILTAEAVPHGG